MLFEDTNYIHKRNKDGLNLFRLLGVLECLPVQQVSSVNVLRVKELTKQLLKENAIPQLIISFPLTFG